MFDDEGRYTILDSFQELDSFHLVSLLENGRTQPSCRLLPSIKEYTIEKERHLVYMTLMNTSGLILHNV